MAKCPSVVSIGSVSLVEATLNPSVELGWPNVDAASIGCMLVTSVDKNISELQEVEECVCIKKQLKTLHCCSKNSGAIGHFVFLKCFAS